MRSRALLNAPESELRASEERFRLEIERVRDYGISPLDREGVVTSWNLGDERIRGWRAEDLGTTFQHILYRMKPAISYQTKSW